MKSKTGKKDRKLIARFKTEITSLDKQDSNG